MATVTSPNTASSTASTSTFSTGPRRSPRIQAKAAEEHKEEANPTPFSLSSPTHAEPASTTSSSTSTRSTSKSSATSSSSRKRRSTQSSSSSTRRPSSPSASPSSSPLFSPADLREQKQRRRKWMAEREELLQRARDAGERASERRGQLALVFVLALWVLVVGVIGYFVGGSLLHHTTLPRTADEL